MTANTTSPTQTGGGWISLNNVTWHGWPVYVSTLNGAVAYEEAGERLVSLPEDVEDAITEILLLDETLKSLPVEVAMRLTGRAH